MKSQPVEGLKNYTLAELTNDPAYQGEAPCLFLPVEQVTKDNVYDLVVEERFPGLRRCLSRHPRGPAPSQTLN